MKLQVGLTAGCVGGGIREEDYARFAVGYEFRERGLLAILGGDVSAKTLEGDAVADSWCFGLGGLGSSFGRICGLGSRSSLGRSSGLWHGGLRCSGLGRSGGRLLRF
jgi:hypothetical protein